jgi:hypothetical protein
VHRVNTFFKPVSGGLKSITRKMEKTWTFEMSPEDRGGLRVWITATATFTGGKFPTIVNFVKA